MRYCYLKASCHKEEAEQAAALAASRLGGGWGMAVSGMQRAYVHKTDETITDGGVVISCNDTAPRMTVHQMAAEVVRLIALQQLGIEQ